MSISATLANALSGLGVSSRSAEVVSSNIANAMTDGYGRREVHLETHWVAGESAGARVAGVSRNVDQYVIGQRWLASADMALDQERSDFWQDIKLQLGTPDDPSSITGLIDQLEASLIEAASRPDSVPRLDGVLRSAERLTGFLNDASDTIQQLRMRADRDIANEVDLLNTSLAQIHELNTTIRANATAGRSVNALMDQRQVVLDRLAEIVPIHIARRSFDQVAIYTRGGAILLDGPQADIDFSPVGVIAADMTVGSGALSQASLRGRPVDSTGNGPLAGGRLGALFEVRDLLAVDAQTDLDAIARNLIDRFSSVAVDPSLPAGAPGLFTDAGTAMIPANEVGVAGRIAVNTLVDPKQGGQLWRLRDGIGLAAAGDVGDATLLYNLADALTTASNTNSGSFAGLLRSSSGLAAELTSLVNGNLGTASQAYDFAKAQHNTLKTAELQFGVDSDAEMRKLMMIEQAYAANARVITTADEMIQLLLNI